ncbi:MAG TPA: aminoglycoside phosphotransferase, partial [Rubrivivax sp.]|nr:aminoglycoside phosphotransferase [Rubrivivax sp.]
MTAADKTIVWADAERQAAFERWMDDVAPRHGLDLPSLAPASADASFRRYLRVGAATADGGSLIVMDAPPSQEDVRPFVHVAALAAAAGLHVPRVLEADAEHGFLLLTD